MPATVYSIRAKKMINGCIWVMLSFYLSGCFNLSPFSTIPPRVDGIASKYIFDKGISNDVNIIFYDDFESWGSEEEPRSKTWQVHKRDGGQVRIVPGKINKGSNGASVAQMACWRTNSDQFSGMIYKLGNYVDAFEGLGDGYDEIYVRYYIKFDNDYKIVKNHGVNIGGRDVHHPDAAWVGLAGVPDIAARGYFFSGLEPAGIPGDKTIEFDIYSYHLDKRNRWGQIFWQDRHISIEVGKWYCIERHLRLNTIDDDENDGNYDGIEEVWIDGQLVTQVKNIRYRKTPKLRITLLALETYYHGLPEYYHKDNPIKVYFDNVAIASEYIGPMSKNPK